MAFIKKTWIDRQSEYPNRRKLSPTGVADTYDVSRDEGLIIKDGNPFNATSMNDLENRVAEIPTTPLAMTALLTAGGGQALATKQVRNVTISTSNPSGGSNGDMWFKYS